MTQLAKNAEPGRVYKAGKHNSIPALTAIIVYLGSAVGYSAGYGRQLVAGDLFGGFADEKVDNTDGANGALNIRVIREGRIQLAVTGVTGVTDIDKDVYASDGNAFTLTRGANSRIGKIVRYVTSTTVEVEFSVALPGLLDGSDLADVANDQAIGGALMIFAIAIAGGAAADTDVTITQKIRVVDVLCQHTGGAGEANDTIQLKSTAAAITDAIAWSGADNVQVRSGTIDDANATIVAGGILRATTVDDDAGDDVGAGIVYVFAIPVA